MNKRLVLYCQCGSGIADSDINIFTDDKDHPEYNFKCQSCNKEFNGYTWDDINDKDAIKIDISVDHGLLLTPADETLNDHEIKTNLLVAILFDCTTYPNVNHSPNINIASFLQRLKDHNFTIKNTGGI